MSTKTTIEWTRNEDGTAGRTWNPVSGCTKVSEGCDHCYAEGIARRFAGSKAFPNGFDVTLHPERLNDPLKWRKPTRVFVNSMSDLFHADIPASYIAKVFAVMAATPQHTYQVLTKRPARMKALIGDPRFGEGGQALLEATEDEETAQALYGAPWPLPNVWLGVSAENQHWAEVRIMPLLATAAAVRFVSAEPLLGPIDLRNLHARNNVFIDCLSGDVKDDKGIYAACPGSVSWVIAGAESGPGARAMDEAWVRSLRDQCGGSAAFFYKQAAVGGKKVPTPELDGRTWTQMPDALVGVA